MQDQGGITVPCLLLSFGLSSLTLVRSLLTCKGFDQCHEEVPHQWLQSKTTTTVVVFFLLESHEFLQRQFITSLSPLE